MHVYVGRRDFPHPIPKTQLDIDSWNSAFASSSNLINHFSKRQWACIFESVTSNCIIFKCTYFSKLSKIFYFTLFVTLKCTLECTNNSRTVDPVDVKTAHF